MTDPLLIIFDLDGTLVDTSKDIVHVVNEVLAENGREALSHDEVMGHVGRGTPHLLAAVLGLSPEDKRVIRARERFVQLYSRDPARQSVLFEGTMEALDALGAVHPMAVVSNKASLLVHSTVEAHGLTGYFHPVLGGEELGRLKPAPHGLRRAMQVHRAAPQRTVMVGDMNLDILAGREAGVRTVFASYGFGTLDGEGDHRPDAVIHRLEELGDVIRNWGATPPG